LQTKSMNSDQITIHDFCRWYFYPQYFYPQYFGI
jgi:hypothetical protein